MLCSNLKKNPSWLLLRLHWGQQRTPRSTFSYVANHSDEWQGVCQNSLRLVTSGGSTPFSTRPHHPFSYQNKSAILTTQVLKYDRGTMKLRLPDNLNAHFITIRLLCSFFFLQQIDLFFSTDASSLQSGERQISLGLSVDETCAAGFNKAPISSKKAQGSSTWPFLTCR